MKVYLQACLWIVVALWSIFPARAYDFQVGGIYYNLNGEEVTVTYGSDKYSSSYSGDVVIPASVTYEGKTYSVTSIGDGAFYSCGGLTSIIIPESVTSIGDEAFSYCSGLTSVTISESVTSIGDETFFWCIGLISVTIPASVERLGPGVFSGCTNLEEIIVSADNPVYSSLDGVLYNKDKTELVKWPDKKLSVTILESVTSIGDWAFYYCSGLTSITIPESVTSIGDLAFYSCIGLTSIIIPESVTSIGDMAFSYCRGLTSVMIPVSVERLGIGVFSGCTNLEEIIVSADNPVYSSLDGVLYNKDKTELVKWPDKKLSVTLPESVTSIGDEAFYSCAGMTSIIIPESVTSIGDRAFFWCEGLTTITLPESVTNIGDYAFANCYQLELVTVHAVTPPEIGPNTFNNYGIPLYVPAGCKEAYQAAEYWRKFMNIKELASSVEPVRDSGARIYVENHTLHVENVDGDYRVYTTTGQLVYAGNAATVSLADAGIYVVCTSSHSQKVVVK